jgi:hypothetical protein
MGRKPDPVRILHGTTIPYLHRPDLDRANACLDFPRLRMTVPDDPITAVRQLQVLHAGQKRRRLALDSLDKKLPGAAPQYAGQGIVDLFGLTKPEDAASLVRGVSLSLRGSGRLDTRRDTPPIHPVITHFPA